MLRKLLKISKTLLFLKSDQIELPYIPFDSRTSIGGPATFLKNLRSYFDKIGFTYAPSLRKATVILFPISHDPKALKKFKARGGKVCQRLDGIYYPARHGEGFEQRNKKIKDIYLGLADHVVFQSEYSRAQCFDMFGERSKNSYSIIVNGVNTDIFYPARDRVFDRSHIHFCTTGSIRSADMLKPLISALDSLTDINFTFHIAGPVKDAACAALIERPYVVHHGNCDMAQVADMLRSSDIFLYSFLNPPCPNSVLEAIASGLPVVGYDSGAMAELVSFSPGLLADAGEHLYHVLENLVPDRLAEKILLAVNNYEKYRQTSIHVCKNYSMDNCGRQYVEVLRNLLKK